MDDGWATSELGHRYGQLDRATLRRFILRTSARVLVALDMTIQRPASGLVYRRRSTVSGGVLSVSYLAGWVPGPLWAVDSNLHVSMSPGFVPGDVLFHPVVPLPDEGELWALPTRLITP